MQSTPETYTMAKQNFFQTATVVLAAMFLCSNMTEAKRVIFFPFLQTSHALTFVKVANALTEMGHQAFVCMPRSVYEKTFKNNTQITPILYGQDLGDVEKLYLEQTKLMEDFWYGDSYIRISHFNHLRRIGISIMVLRTAFNDSSFMKKVDETEADLMVFDSIPHHRSSLALAYKFNTPFVMMGNYYDATAARIPIHFTSTPHVILRDADTTLTFFQRIKLAMFYSLLNLHDPGWDNSILATAAPEKPTVSYHDLISKAELFIFETDHIKDLALPMLPNTKLVGGMSPAPARPLSGKLSAFVRKSNKGVVFVSFGTFGFNIPKKVLDKMNFAFRSLPLHVIWRVNATSPDPEKIMTTEWVPQNDLLGDVSTRVFVSHCGSWGIYEAIYHGVPILCLPMFADQFYNAYRITKKGFGLTADLRTVSSEEFAHLINELAFNTTYQRKIQHASELFRILYKIPAREAAFWIDHVMQYGGSYMRSIGQEMPLYQYLCLDIAAVVCFGIIAIGTVTWYCLFRPSFKMKPKTE